MDALTVFNNISDVNILKIIYYSGAETPKQLLYKAATNTSGRPSGINKVRSLDSKFKIVKKTDKSYGKIRRLKHKLRIKEAKSKRLAETNPKHDLFDVIRYTRDSIHDLYGDIRSCEEDIIKVNSNDYETESNYTSDEDAVSDESETDPDYNCRGCKKPIEDCSCPRCDDCGYANPTIPDSSYRFCEPGCNYTFKNPDCHIPHSRQSFYFCKEDCRNYKRPYWDC